MNRDQSIEMARKLRALAEKAEGGEKESAAKKLARFCQKHGLDEEEYSTEQIRVKIAYKNQEERSLLSNVMCMVMESDNVKGTDKDNTFSFLCSPYQFDLIKDAYAYYRKLYREYCEAVLLAMVVRNEIGNTKKSNDKPFSMEEMNEEEKKEWEETMQKMQQPAPQEEPPKDPPPEQTAEKGPPQPPPPPPEPNAEAKKQERAHKILFVMEPNKWERPRPKAKLFLS
jgi:hypothetical protein